MLRCEPTGWTVQQCISGPRQWRNIETIRLVMTYVKICGVRRAEDAQLAVDAGADAIGFNFWKGTARYVEPADAAQMIRELPENVLTVGVFVDEASKRVLEIAEQTGLRAIQLHGIETPDYMEKLTGPYRLIKAIKIKPGFDPRELTQFPAAEIFLLDGFERGMVGGTGKTFDWTHALKAKAYGKILLAGGLNPTNVGEAILTVAPWGVDVASGVESEPGVKDSRLVREFIRAAREADAGIAGAESKEAG
jgi:phosphoribosylanthranilate isomerase